MIEAIEKQSLVARADELGKKIVAGLNTNLANVKGVNAVRGLGLLIGIELDRPCKEMMQLALNAGLVINVTADSVIRLLPPLVLSDEEADSLIEKLSSLIKEFLGES